MLLKICQSISLSNLIYNSFILLKIVTQNLSVNVTIEYLCQIETIFEHSKHVNQVLRARKNRVQNLVTRRYCRLSQPQLDSHIVGFEFAENSRLYNTFLGASISSPWIQKFSETNSLNVCKERILLNIQ